MSSWPNRMTIQTLSHLLTSQSSDSKIARPFRPLSRNNVFVYLVNHKTLQKALGGSQCKKMCGKWITEWEQGSCMYSYSAVQERRTWKIYSQLYSQIVSWHLFWWLVWVGGPALAVLCNHRLLSQSPISAQSPISVKPTSSCSPSLVTKPHPPFQNFQENNTVVGHE